ncbi:MAG: hypothetical protein R3Y12_06955 [Clostridia bacterium]
MVFRNKISKVVDVEKSEKEFEENVEKIQLEKNDLPAMLISAFLVFVPAIALFVGTFVGVIWLFFFR